MTAPMTQERRPASGWWARNRWALAALVPLGALAVAASSYQYVTLYKPNEFTRVEKASGPTLAYREDFRSNRKAHQRAVTLRVTSSTSRALPPKQAGAKGATLWEVEILFSAKPDVPLEGCSLALLDAQGREYGLLQADFSPDITDRPISCVPAGAPGPQFDFVGDLKPAQGAARPASWPVTARFAMPEGRKPAYVRISWAKPNAALLPLP